jgi:hypothetical protein
MYFFLFFLYLFPNENMFGDLKAIHRTFQKDSGENSSEKHSLLKKSHEVRN